MTTYNPLAPRRFGVELEVSRRLTTVNYADKFYNKHWQELNKLIRSLYENRQISSGWKLKVDTSCGGEIVSPILIGNNGLREVALVCDKVRSYAKKHGLPAADGECGLHFHFDAADIHPRQLGNLFVLVHMAEVIIYTMYPNRNWEYCAPLDVNMKQACRFRDMVDVRDTWYRGSNNVREHNKEYGEKFINSTSPGEHYDGTRYHGFNIHCYWRQNSVEFRYGSGTFDAIHIRAFYEMFLCLVNTAVNNKSIKVDDVILTMKHRELKSFYSQNYRFRKHILDMARRCGWTRTTLKLIVEKLRKHNKKLLDKDLSSRKVIITSTNKHRYWYMDANNGQFYDECGRRVNLGSMAIMDSRHRVDFVPVPTNDNSGKIIQVMSSTNKNVVFNFQIRVYPKSQPRDIDTIETAIAASPIYVEQID